MADWNSINSPIILGCATLLLVVLYILVSAPVNGNKINSSWFWFFLFLILVAFGSDWSQSVSPSGVSATVLESQTASPAILLSVDTTSHTQATESILVIWPDNSKMAMHRPQLEEIRQFLYSEIRQLIDEGARDGEGCIEFTLRISHSPAGKALGVPALDEEACIGVANDKEAPMTHYRRPDGTTMVQAPILARGDTIGWALTYVDAIWSVVKQ